MYFKKLGIFLFLALSVLGVYGKNIEAANVGFVPSSIWYSKDPFEEGDKIKIYTLIFNGDKRELSGTVLFFDKDVLLGKKEFVVPPETAKDISVNWTVDAGSHSIYAKIENAKFLISKGKYENADVAETQTKESSRTVAKKIIAKNTDAESSADDTGFESIKNIGNTIEEKTPSFIAKPVVLGASIVEDFRTNTGATMQTKKEETKMEVDTLSKAPPSKTTNSSILKPLKYIQLFFLTIISFLFNNKIIFYLVSLALVFFILRFIWRRFF